MSALQAKPISVADGLYTLYDRFFGFIFSVSYFIRCRDSENHLRKNLKSALDLYISGTEISENFIQLPPYIVFNVIKGAITNSA